MTDRTAVYATRTYGGVGAGRRELFSYPDHECVRHIIPSTILTICLNKQNGDRSPGPR